MNYNTIVNLGLTKSNPDISVIEFALIPFYLVVFVAISKIISEKFYRNEPYKKYIVPGVLFKIFGGIFITLIYVYYYKGGDTCFYFLQGRIVNAVLMEEPMTGISVLFNDFKDLPNGLHFLKPYMFFGLSADTYYVVKLTAILLFFSFNSIIITAIVYSFISFWCIWQLYLLFVRLYPNLYSPFAYSILFIPSAVVWGSGIFKDTITLSMLCLLFAECYKVFIEKKSSNKIFSFLLIGIAFIIISKIKIYILFASLPPLLILITYKKLENNKSIILKAFIIPLIILFACTELLYLSQKVSGSEFYSVDKIMTRSKITRDYLESMSTSGSGYTLGKFDESPLGYIQVIPAAINVTFFRPYIWESRNVIMLLSALESFGVFVFFLMTVFRYGFYFTFAAIKKEQLITFCFIFSLTLGYFAGISTYNFGSLVRYKIPALPFFISALVIVYYTKKEWYLKKQEATL